MKRLSRCIMICLFCCPQFCASLAAATRMTEVQRFGVAPVELPLKMEQARISIDLQIAHTQVTSLFENPTDRRLETRFAVTLPTDAVVTGFAYWFKGQRIEATVEEKVWARSAYASIVSRKRDPALGERTDLQMFSATVFPVEPKSELKVEVTYAQILPLSQAATLRYAYPMLTDHALAQFGFELDIKHHQRIQSLRCSIPQAAINLSGKQGRVAISLTDFKPAGDLEVVAWTDAASDCLCIMSKPTADGYGYYLVLSMESERKIPQPPEGTLRWTLAYPLLDETAQRTLVGQYLGSIRASDGNQVITATPEIADVLPRLWAHAYIRRLTQKLSEHELDEIRLIAVQASRQFTIESPFTAFLAIPTSERPSSLRPWQPIFRKPWAAPEVVLESNEEVVQHLKEMGIMEGYPGGGFKGNQLITRIEAITALARSILKTSHQMPPGAIQMSGLERSLQQDREDRRSGTGSSRRSREPSAARYPDVPFNHWSYDAVERFTEMGLISGYPDGTFRGRQSLDRYQLAMLTVGLIQRITDQKNVVTFHRRPRDVPADHWARPYVVKAVEWGILTPFPDGTFRGNQPLTRNEFAAALERIFHVTTVTLFPTLSHSSENLALLAPEWVRRVIVVTPAGKRYQLSRCGSTWSALVPEAEFLIPETTMRVRLESEQIEQEYMVRVVSADPQPGHRKFDLHLTATRSPDMVLAWNTTGDLTELYSPRASLFEGTSVEQGKKAPSSEWLVLALLHKHQEHVLVYWRLPEWFGTSQPNPR